MKSFNLSRQLCLAISLLLFILAFQSYTGVRVEENISITDEPPSTPIIVQSPEPLPVKQIVARTLSPAEKAKIQKQKKYVKRFAETAQAEMRKFGIPASITLAQGLIETNAGESRLATENNNHFGIKCFSRKCKSGHCRNHTDDSHKDFFRVYKSAWESYRAHSEFLRKKRYRGLFELDPHDYKDWAHGLQMAGYATDKQYAKKLINVVETLDLQIYDQI